MEGEPEEFEAFRDEIEYLKSVRSEMQKVVDVAKNSVEIYGRCNCYRHGESCLTKQDENPCIPCAVKRYDEAIAAIRKPPGVK